MAWTCVLHIVLHVLCGTHTSGVHFRPPKVSFSAIFAFSGVFFYKAFFQNWFSQNPLMGRFCPSGIWICTLSSIQSKKNTRETFFRSQSMFLLPVWQHYNMTRQNEWQAFTLTGRSPKVLICSIIVLSISRLSITGELIKVKRKLWEMNLLLYAGVTSIPEHKRCEGSLVPLRDCGENVH